ncbi:MAG: LacI family DNA-binding transcriptional regulator, partial [Chloroflexota bacterium]
MPRRPVLKDVADRAHVSLTAASLVLNGKAGANIPKATQDRIVAAAAELGYRPNALARGLRSGRSATIGFVSDEIATTPFAGAMIQGAQDAAWEAGKLLLLINTGRDRGIEATALELLHERHVEGVIYATMYHQVITPPAALLDGPAVLLDARAHDAALASVVPDEVAAAYEATETLLRV